MIQHTTHLCLYIMTEDESMKRYDIIIETDLQRPYLTYPNIIATTRISHNITQQMHYPGKTKNISKNQLHIKINRFWRKINRIVKASSKRNNSRTRKMKEK